MGSGMELHGARNVIASEDRVDERIVIKEHATPTNRNFVDDQTLEGVTNVEVRVAVISRRVADTGGSDCLRVSTPACRILIIQEVRPSVVEVETDTLASRRLNCTCSEW